jgi:multimeric flavodoxin WrbA
MSKTILILSASPRRGGNSDLLCDQLLKGAQEAGLQAEKIFLKDKEINYCTGCGSCFDRGKGCSQKDDMSEILEKMIQAQVIVMATPVYFYTMNAQMKTLIDRTCARYTEIKEKQFYFIVTAADDTKQATEATLEGFRAFLSCLHEPKEMGVLYGIGTWKVGEIKEKPVMQEAYDMGRNC